MNTERDILKRLSTTESSGPPTLDVTDGVLDAIRHRRPNRLAPFALVAPAVACALAVAAVIWATQAYFAYADPINDLATPVMMVMQ